MRNAVVLTAITLSVTGCLTEVEPTGIAKGTTDNSAPSIEGSPAAEVTAIDNYSFTPTASDPNDDVLVYSIIAKDTTYGSVTLSWTAPTENEDGSVLTDLGGYRLYWGKTRGNYTDSVTIDNASITTYVVDNIAAGTYEFVGTSFNAAGVESRYSNPATKVVN